MKIIHFCQYKVRHSNGIQVAVWELAKHQARFGHQVEIISLGRKPHADEVDIVAKEGIILTGYSGRLPHKGIITNLVARLASHAECVCHIHSVFIPWHSILCRRLSKLGVCYFVSPHGNLLSTELSRKRFKKQVYLHLIEMRVLRRASGILCVSEPEVFRVNSLIGQESGLHLGNGIDPGTLPDFSQCKHNKDGKISGVFLGKSDVMHKGFDRMFDLAKHIPGGVDFYVIRHNQDNMKAEFDDLMQKYVDDCHIRVHPPVYGDEKAKALARANVYIHLPRWEVFGMAIVEAAMMGLPLILSSDCDLANEAKDAGAALVLSFDDEREISKLTELIADNDALQIMGKNARHWAIKTYSSEVVAARSISLYQQNISTN